ncbi:hypothetical protein ACZ90_56980 [Streptomyces albus subsp. albus]|nr:hypothetical protein ACZ90_56980 [Streptomyces albus subsp. albus]
MTADPNDPETFTDPDTFTDPVEALDEMDEPATVDAAGIDTEASEGDRAEQHTDLSPHRDEPVTGADLDSANEADRAEQARVVELNEDEYR